MTVRIDHGAPLTMRLRSWLRAPARSGTQRWWASYGVRCPRSGPSAQRERNEMKEALPYFQNGVAFAFVLLGVFTAIGWARRRDRSLGLLALAIILLSVVSLLGRIPALFGIHPPLLSEV